MFLTEKKNKSCVPNPEMTRKNKTKKQKPVDVKRVCHHHTCTSKQRTAGKSKIQSLDGEKEEEPDPLISSILICNGQPNPDGDTSWSRCRPGGQLQVRIAYGKITDKGNSKSGGYLLKNR